MCLVARFIVREIRMNNVISRQYNRVMAYFFCKTGKKAMAEDLTQELFVRYIVKLPNIKEPEKWIKGTMGNMLREYYRGCRMDSKVDRVDCDLHCDAKYCYIGDVKMLVCDAIEFALDQSDEETSRVFELIHDQRYTYGEAASTLGLNERQARYRYRKVLDLLHHYLKDQGIEGLNDMLE